MSQMEQVSHQLLREERVSFPRWLTGAQWVFVVLAVLAAVAQGLRLSPVAVEHGPSLMVAFSLAFVVAHGWQRFGWRELGVFFAIVFVIGNVYENLSIATSFPFGWYHYTEQLGPKFIFTPLIINVAYFQMVYLVWCLTNVVIDRYTNRLAGAVVVVQPVVATFIMVMWDLMIDPFMSTVSEHWVWHDGGSFYGVPFQNYAGWFLCVYTMFQLFALWTRRSSAPGIPAVSVSRSSWTRMTVAYLAWPLAYLLMAVTAPDQELVARNGQAWQLDDLLQAGALSGLCTMVFIGVLVLTKVHALHALPTVSAVPTGGREPAGRSAGSGAESRT